MAIDQGQKSTYMAWMIPGIQPRIVKQMLIKKSAPHPRSRKTPRGGKIKAKMILQISLEDKMSVLNVETWPAVRNTRYKG